MFGLLAKSEQATADAACAPGIRGCSSRDGVDASDAAHTNATISTIAFGAGLIVGLAGAYLWLTSGKAAPRATSATPPVAPRGRGLVLEGTW